MQSHEAYLKFVESVEGMLDDAGVSHYDSDIVAPLLKAKELQELRDTLSYAKTLLSFTVLVESKMVANHIDELIWRIDQLRPRSEDGKQSHFTKGDNRHTMFCGCTFDDRKESLRTDQIKVTLSDGREIVLDNVVELNDEGEYFVIRKRNWTIISGKKGGQQ